MSLYAVVILEHIGLEQFKGALGWATMCHGVANAIYFPITGTLVRMFSYETRKVNMTFKKVQVGNDQEKAQSVRNSHSKNRSGKKTN